MSNEFYDVITVGSNTIDAFVYTDKSESISIKTLDSEIKFISYPLGSKLKVNELDFYTGGGGTNTAVCLARLGLKTAYIGKIGNDLNSNTILEELKAEGVDFLGIISSSQSQKTGYSIILDSIERNRTILTYRGANDFLESGDINFEKLQTKWFHLSAMIQKSFKTLEKIAAYARNRKIKISFNPNNYLCGKGKDYLKEASPIS
jgi:ribokinase